MKIHLVDENPLQKKFITYFIKDYEYVPLEDSDIVLYRNVYPIVPISHSRQPRNFYMSGRLTKLFFGIVSDEAKFSNEGYCYCEHDIVMNNFLEALPYRQNKYYSYYYIFMVLRYLIEKARHMIHGAPLRSPLAISERYSVCSECPFFDRISEGEGQCSICCCGLKREGNEMNKLAWKTTVCPHNPPKWF